MIPIDKSNTPSRYYRVNSKKKIGFSRKFARFITRYLIPTLIVAIALVITDIFLMSKFSYDTTKDTLILCLILLGVGFISVVLCNLWFLLITKNQDT